MRSEKEGRRDDDRAARSPPGGDQEADPDDPRRRVIACLVPENAQSATEVPDFLGRLRAIYGDKVLAVSGAELVSEDRSRY